MKARCVDNKELDDKLTVGRVYEVIIDCDNDYWFIDDTGNGRVALIDCFELLPDAPKSDWVRCGESLPNAAGNWVEKYINLQTGIVLTFDPKEHSVIVLSIHGDKEYVEIKDVFANAFANLPGVNYEWKD